MARVGGGTRRKGKSGPLWWSSMYLMEDSLRRIRALLWGQRGPLADSVLVTNREG